MWFSFLLGWGCLTNLIHPIFSTGVDLIQGDTPDGKTFITVRSDILKRNINHNQIFIEKSIATFMELLIVGQATTCLRFCGFFCIQFWVLIQWVSGVRTGPVFPWFPSSYHCLSVLSIHPRTIFQYRETKSIQSSTSQWGTPNVAWTHTHIHSHTHTHTHTNTQTHNEQPTVSSLISQISRHYVVLLCDVTPFVTLHPLWRCTLCDVAPLVALHPLWRCTFCDVAPFVTLYPFVMLHPLWCCTLLWCCSLCDVAPFVMLHPLVILHPFVTLHPL